MPMKDSQTDVSIGGGREQQGWQKGGEAYNFSVDAAQSIATMTATGTATVTTFRAGLLRSKWS